MRILLVEDHSDTAQVFSRLLHRAGHEVACANGVVEAERLCREQQFDLLICDIGLPDGDGWALMRDLHAACGIRGIALTGYAYEADEQRSREAGFEEHLSKPVSIDSLLSAIGRVTGAAVVSSADTADLTAPYVGDCCLQEPQAVPEGQGPAEGPA